jgi:hypothetical protein
MLFLSLKGPLFSLPTLFPQPLQFRPKLLEALQQSRRDPSIPLELPLPAKAMFKGSDGSSKPVRIAQLSDDVKRGKMVPGRRWHALSRAGSDLLNGMRHYLARSIGRLSGLITLHVVCIWCLFVPEKRIYAIACLTLFWAPILLVAIFDRNP